jgi:uncharacterized repeat protein (TIGR01451 family)
MTGQPSVNAATVSYDGPPAEIPDHDYAGVNVPINVSNFTGSISDLNVLIGGSSCTTEEGATTVGIDHTYDSDLVVKLTSPRGTTVTLVGGVGGSGHNFCQTMLDDEGGGVPVQSLSSSTDAAPFTGNFRSAEPLAAFRGEDPNGTWILNVYDRYAADSGHVNAFSLVMSGYECGQTVTDLSLTQTGTPDPVGVGAELTYQMVVNNVGASPASGVVVTDALPANADFVSAQSSAGGCFKFGNSLECNLGGLAAGAGATVTVVVKPTATGVLSNTATVRSGEADSDTSNNSATVATTVQEAADLSITNVDSPDPLVGGGAITYTIRVTNLGPSPATGVVVTDTGELGGGTFNIGDLDANASATVTVTGSGSSPGVYANTARVTSNEPDPHPANNVATQSTKIITLTSFVLNRPDLAGCPSGDRYLWRGTIYLSGGAPAGTVVNLSNTNSKATIPASVEVPTGANFVDFTIRTNAVVENPVSGLITATLGSASFSQSITVRPIGVDYIFLQPSRVRGGDSSRVTAMLECRDSPQDIVVVFSSDQPGLASPYEGAVVVHPGNLSAETSVTTTAVSSKVFVVFTGTANGHSNSQTLTLDP